MCKVQSEYRRYYGGWAEAGLVSGQTLGEELLHVPHLLLAARVHHPLDTNIITVHCSPLHYCSDYLVRLELVIWKDFSEFLRGELTPLVGNHRVTVAVGLIKTLVHGTHQRV